MAQQDDGSWDGWGRRGPAPERPRAERYELHLNDDGTYDEVVTAIPHEARGSHISAVTVTVTEEGRGRLHFAPQPPRAARYELHPNVDGTYDGLVTAIHHKARDNRISVVTVTEQTRQAFDLHRQIYGDTSFQKLIGRCLISNSDTRFGCFCCRKELNTNDCSMANYVYGYDDVLGGYRLVGRKLRFTCTTEECQAKTIKLLWKYHKSKKASRCESCGLKVQPDKRCTGCFKVCYCSKLCQVKHYSVHKPMCEFIKKSKNRGQMENVGALLDGNIPEVD